MEFSFKFSWVLFFVFVCGTLFFPLTWKTGNLAKLGKSWKMEWGIYKSLSEKLCKCRKMWENSALSFSFCAIAMKDYMTASLLCVDNIAEVTTCTWQQVVQKVIEVSGNFTVPDQRETLVYCVMQSVLF